LSGEYNIETIEMKLFAASVALANAVNGELTKVYDEARECANNYLIENPDTPEKLIQNELYGGRNDESYVGFVSKGDSNLIDLRMMDGPQGLRSILSGSTDIGAERVSWASAASHAVAQSPHFSYYQARIMMDDWDIVDSNIALTPGLEIHRVPTNGRNWEYMGGEDATLAKLGWDYVRGLQSRNITATAKHFAMNTQELNRFHNIAQVDEETFMQTYAKVFVPSIEAGVGSIMCSYNRISFWETPEKNSWLCGDDYAAGVLLRNSLGFKGALMSDWNAQIATTTNGETVENRQVMDWEMHWAEPVRYKVPRDAYEEITRRSLTAFYATGIFNDEGKCPNAKVSTDAPPGIEELPEKYKASMINGNAEKFGTYFVAESMVMLKNQNNLLPLPADKSLKVLLTGEAMLSGGGSGDSAANSHLFPNGGESLANDGGPWAQEKMQTTLKAALPLGSIVDWDFDVESDGVIDYSLYDLILSFGAQFRSEAYLVGDTDGYLQIDRCDSQQDHFIPMLYGTCDYPAEIEKFQLARNQISNPTKVISITTTGGGFNAFDFISGVDAALTMYYPGQSLADALSQVLIGKLSPGGRLVTTLPNLEDDQKHIQSPVARFNEGLVVGFGADVKQSSSTSGSGRNMLLSPGYYYDPVVQEITDIIQYGVDTSNHTEKDLIGYKYYEKYNMIPLFPFGFGLSYQTPTIEANLDSCKDMDSCSIGVTVEGLSSNDEQVASTVVHVYLGYQSADQSKDVMRPIKSLAAFKKVWKSSTFQIELKTEDFSTAWDVESKTYVTPCAQDKVAGSFTVYVAKDSADIIATQQFACEFFESSSTAFWKQLFSI